MGKIKVTGFAEIEFETEVIILNITAIAIGSSTSSAIETGKLKVEQLLSLFNDKIGITPQSFILKNEKVTKTYNNNTYEYEKEMKLKLNADLNLIEKITNILKDVSNIEYRTEFELTDVKNKEIMVINSALEDSRIKAENIALALNKKIIGTEDVVYETSQASELKSLARSICIDNNDNNNLAGLLKKPSKKIQKSLAVTWLTD